MKRSILLLLLVVSCQTYQFNISENTDPVTGDKIILTRNNYVKPANYGGISIDLGIFKKGTQGQQMMLMVEYTGNEWLFVSKGNSLLFNVDGVVIKFPAIGDGSLNKRKAVTGAAGVMVTERASYEFTRAQLERIAAGQIVRGGLEGQKGRADFEVTEENKANFRKMLELI